MSGKFEVLIWCSLEISFRCTSAMRIGGKGYFERILQGIQQPDMDDIFVD